MNEKNGENIFFFKIDGTYNAEIKKRGLGGDKTKKSFINQTIFKNFFTSVISKEDLSIEFHENFYFVIKFNFDTHTKAIQDFIEKYEIKIRSILSKDEIYASISKKNQQKILQLEKINKTDLKLVQKLDLIKDDIRIGDQLKEKMINKEEKNFEVEIMLVKTENKEEISDFKDEIINSKLILNPDKAISFDNFRIFRCKITAQNVPHLIKKPFIQKIELKSKAIKQSIGKIIPDYKLSSINFKGYSKRTYPEICIIDSGISGEIKDRYVKNNEFFSFVDSEDNWDHGTRVSSLALFGDQLIKKKNDLYPDVHLINVKIDDLYEDYPLYDGIIKAIEKYSDSCKIFNISYCFFSIDPDLREEILAVIDKIIHDHNVMVVISSGNIDPKQIKMNLSNYPDYLFNYPILCPSDLSNAFAIGSMTHTNSISKHTRFCISATLFNKNEDKVVKFKPEIVTFGGDNTYNTIPIISEPMNEIPVINSKSNITYDLGTSLSAPLLSNYLAYVYERYKNDYSNSETFKSILLACCKYNEINGYPYFFIDSKENLLKNKIIIISEGKLKPKETLEDDKKKEKVYGKVFSFYLPNEAESIDIISIQSTNNKKDNYKTERCRLVIKITKKNGSGSDLKKKYGNIGKFHTVTYGHYEFKRNYAGLTRISIWTQTYGINYKKIKNMIIRYGITVKINLKDKHKLEIKEIYSEIVKKSKPSLGISPKSPVKSKIKT